MRGPDLGDRRACARLDVTGELWASLATAQRVRLLNLASSGALIEVPVTLDVRVLREIDLELTPDGPLLPSVVRHLSPSPDRAEWQHVGLEFLRLSASQHAAIDAYLADPAHRFSS